MSWINWVVLHLAQTYLRVQSLCLCSPKQSWASPHPAFHSRAMQDHSLSSTLTYAHPEICTSSAFSGDSHKPTLSGTFWKQFTSEIPMPTSEIGSYSPSPHSIPACVHFSIFTNTADSGCNYRNVALIQSLWLSPCYSFSSSSSPFPPICQKAVDCNKSSPTLSL